MRQFFSVSLSQNTLSHSLVIEGGFHVSLHQPRFPKGGLRAFQYQSPRGASSWPIAKRRSSGSNLVGSGRGNHVCPGSIAPRISLCFAMREKCAPSSASRDLDGPSHLVPDQTGSYGCTSYSRTDGRHWKWRNSASPRNSLQGDLGRRKWPSPRIAGVSDWRMIKALLATQRTSLRRYGSRTGSDIVHAIAE
jgi:hypothetical protein